MRWGFFIIGAASFANLVLNHLFTPHAGWAILPVATYSFGWALLTPVVTLLVLDQAPDRRGLAASVHSCLGSLANALVAGVLAPLVMHSVQGLAWAALGLMALGLLAWSWVKRQVT